MRRTSGAAPRRRLTLRTRLTLTYAGLITGSGAVLILLVYLYMRFVPSYQVMDAPAVGTDGPDWTPSNPTSGVAIASAEDFLTNLLRASGIALVVLAVLGGMVGWIVAGRIVRPLAEIGEAARRASEGNLDQRVGLDAPHDEIRDLAETFDGMLASLEASFTAQRRFTANASHELQSPLATTKTMIDVTLADPEASAAELRALAERVREVNHGSIETVDALLALATAQHTEVSAEPVDLGALTRSVVSALSPQATEANVELPVPTGAGWGLASAVLLRQAVSNLVLNSIRHGGSGSRARVWVSTTTEHATVVVSNGGPQVLPEELDVLREPFVRGRGRILTRGAGHGLGLAIVEATMSAIGGTLTLEANPEGGLTATLTMPVLTDAVAPNLQCGEEVDEMLAHRA